MPDLSIFKLDSQTITIKDTTARQTAESAKALATAATTAGNAVREQITELKNDLDENVSDLKSALNQKTIVTRNIWQDKLEAIRSTGVSYSLEGSTYHLSITTAGANKGVYLKAFDVSQMVGKRIYISLLMENATFSATARLRINTVSNDTNQETGTLKSVTLTNDVRVNTYFDIKAENSYLFIGLYSATSSLAVGQSWDITEIQCELGRNTTYITHEVKALDGILTPELFGAVGDGVTDDSGAIQDLCNNTLSVTLPERKTYVCNNIELRDYHSFNLNGATLQTIANAPIFITSSNDDALKAVHIYNGHLKGNSTDKTQTSQSLIYLSCLYSTFENLTFADCYVGLYLIPRTNGSSGSTVENVFRNLKFNTCYYIGLAISYQGSITDNRIEGIFASAPEGADNNIYIGKSAGTIISNIHLYGKPKNHLYLRSTAHTFLINSYIEGAYTEIAVDAKITRTLTISNVIFVASGADLIGIKLEDLGGTSEGYRYVSLNGITFESYLDLGAATITPIVIGQNVIATGVNLVINDLYGSIKDIDTSTGLTATRIGA